MKELEREILIIGAGPAGLSAAIEAAKAGAKVTVADEHDTIGGQLYKQIHKFFGAADNHAGMRGFEIARKLEQEAKELGVELDKLFADTIMAMRSCEESINNYMAAYTV